MIRLENGILVQRASELPSVKNPQTLFIDLETGGEGDKESFSPYGNGFICGISISWDSNPNVYYIPIAHREARWNVDRVPVFAWLREMIRKAKQIVNHNVKFDAHFIAEEGDIDLSRIGLRDTQTLSKIIDSDRGYGKPGYALDELALDFLGVDMSPEVGKLQKTLAAIGASDKGRRPCKDYSRVPADILGNYACKDVAVTRDLWQYLLRETPEDCRFVFDTECAYTGVLFDMERQGMKLDLEKLEIDQYRYSLQVLQLQERLHKLTGSAYRPHVSEDCYDLLCNHFGLPVLGWTGEEEGRGNPSFDKEAMRNYTSHPTVIADPKLSEVVAIISKYRQVNSLLSGFIDKYLVTHKNGVIHPSYVQSVRTGRSACRNPNMQNLPERAKHYIIPPDGYTMVSNDYSQIEFRFIVHYSRDPEPILAYNENPDTDFHAWVAEMTGTKRKSAKNVNFCIAFGGGKPATLRTMSADMDLVGGMVDNATQRLEEMGINPSDEDFGPLREALFHKLCKERALEVFNKYHATLPGIRRISKICSERIATRGYVKNLVGRRRHLPKNQQYRGFNAVVQSGAADLMKRQAVLLSPRYNPWSRSAGLLPIGVVHDELVSLLPNEEATQAAVSRMVAVLEAPEHPLRVPIRTSSGMSRVSWAAAGKDEASIEASRDAETVAAALSDRDAAIGAISGIFWRQGNADCG